jgi:hypothetical protein
MVDQKRKAREAESPSLANASLNSSRRSGTQETGFEKPARASKERDSTDSTKVPDEQIPKS